MRFLQIHTFYAEYWRSFYHNRPELAGKTYVEQLRALLADGFSAGHLVAPYMGDLGWESDLIVANCFPLQYRWCAENGFPSPVGSPYAVVREQITRFRPDVLYLSDPITFDSRFIRSLPERPELVLGWRAAVIPPDTDWTAFDLMLSSTRGCLDKALLHGAKQARYGVPGFMAEQAERYAPIKRELDVSFIGSWSVQHERRNFLIRELARAAQGTPPSFTPYLCLYTGQPAGLPPECVRFHHGEAWGSSMYAIMAASRLTFNASAEIADQEAPNMRHMEGAGMGALLLTERLPNLDAFFLPDQVAAFDEAADMLELAAHHLQHPDVMAVTAARGQAHCLHHYAMQVRARAMALRIRQALQSNAMADRLSPELALRMATALARAEEAHEEKQRLREAVQTRLYAGAASASDNTAYARAWRALSPSQKPADTVPPIHAEAMRGLCAAAINDISTARRALYNELEAWPENDDARFALSQILMRTA